MFSQLRNLFQDKRKKNRKSAGASRLRVESLENRDMLTAVALTDHEQLLLELINRARLDPLGEVALNSSVNSLNEGVTGTTITSTPKQPLASVQELVNAGRAHALDMLENDYFSHFSQPGGEDPTARAAAAGYSGDVGENIAWNGSTGPINHTDETLLAHANLFASPSHRVNLLFDSYEEIGTAVEFGDFFDGANNFNAAVVAEEFGFNSGNSYLTGVAYSDTVIADNFYSVGESESGIRITAVDVSSGDTYFTHTGPSGGYNLKLPAGTYTVTAAGGRLDDTMVVTDVSIGSENVKVDFDTSTTAQDVQDLVGFNSGEEFWVGESNGTTLTTRYYGEFSSATTYNHLGVGDFNGDGLDDVVARAASTGELVVAVNTGNSSFAAVTWGSLTTITGWDTIVVGDFNGDGLDDVLGRANSDGTFWLAESNGNGFTNSHWGGLLNSITWSDISVGDFNGDGQDDVASRAPDGTWWASISNGTRLNNAYWGRWSTAVTWSDVSIGDFNGDGLDDIAGRANNAFWWVNEATTDDFFLVRFWGSWTGSVTWDDVTVGDFNGDGRDDIGGRANGQWWLAISDGARFSNEYWGFWTTSTTWHDVSKIDANGDGKDDLIGRASNGQWWVFSSTGTAFTGVLGTTWSPGATWEAVMVGNFA